MIGIFREFARVFSSYRRWHAGVIGRSGRPSADGARHERASGRVATRTASRPGAVIDLAGARRLRCLSEPCANTRLAVALLRAQRPAPGRTRDFGMSR